MTKTIEAFERWNLILDRVENEDKSLAVCLRKGFLTEVEGNEVVIEFENFDRYYKKIAEKREDIISKVVNEILEGHFRIKFILDDEENDGSVPF